MGQNVTAQLEFKKDFKGKLILADGEIGIGLLPNEARPYDLLQGALVSCLHSTLLEILVKKRIEIESVSYRVSGEKRDEIPTTLKSVTIEAEFVTNANAEQIRKSMELASKYCSVYNTLAQVAEMKINLSIKPYDPNQTT
jgi:putative redox protein